MVFGKPLYTTVNTEVDYSKGEATFYEVEHLHSLNQSETNPKPKTIRLPLLIAWEVIKAFEEIGHENERRVTNLFESS